jgi:hypothetical protein
LSRGSSSKLLLHQSPNHHATRTASTLGPTHGRIAHMLRTQRQSEPSRTPARIARIRTETVSRNPLCKIRANFIDLELKLRIESAQSPNSLCRTLPPINRSFTRRHCHPNTSYHSRPSLSHRLDESSYCLEEGRTLSPPPSEQPSVPELHRTPPSPSPSTGRAASPSPASWDWFPPQ